MGELTLACAASSRICELALTPVVSCGAAVVLLGARGAECWGGAGAWGASGLSSRAGSPSGLCAAFSSGPLMSQFFYL